MLSFCKQIDGILPNSIALFNEECMLRRQNDTLIIRLLHKGVNEFFGNQAKKSLINPLQITDFRLK